MEGWIKLHRKIMQWEWYKIPNMYHLFSHLLLSANHEDGKWQGIDIKRGELITGLKAMNANTGISIQSIRTCIERLKSTGEITIKSTNKYSIITLCNYEEYQFNENPTNNQINKPDNKQSTNNQQTTNNKQEYKNEDNILLKENLIKEKIKEAEEYEKWRIENDKKNEEFLKRERLKDEEEARLNNYPPDF